MTKQTNINIRTDSDVKANADLIFQQLGLNISSAVNIFLRAVIRQGGIPFDVKLDIPNEETAAAIEEGRKLMHDKDAVGYTNMDDLRRALDKC